MKILLKQPRSYKVCKVFLFMYFSEYLPYVGHFSQLRICAKNSSLKTVSKAAK